MVSARPRDLSSLTLHFLAMGAMLCDHLWATVVPGNDWLTWIGRLAFPIFAFLLAEGYCHTRNYEKYRQRLLTGAVLSELPFNLMYGGSLIYPFQQDVLWTFLLALVCMKRMDRVLEKYNHWKGWALAALTAFAFFLLGQTAMVDYGGYGILMVLLFRLTRERGWLGKVLQLLGMYYINWEMMRGLVVPVTAFGFAMEIPRQGFAVAALLPIWLYRGREGYKSKAVRLFCYGFYPVHMLILGLLSK